MPRRKATSIAAVRRDRRQAALYARVSSKEQAEGFSIPAQLKLLYDYAEKNGMKVARVFQEAETAKRAGRSAFEELKTFLHDNQRVGSLLVEKTDRLYRNFADYVALDFEQMNLAVHLVKEGQVLSPESHSHQKLFHGIKVAMAKNYIDNLSEEVKKGLNEKASQGFYPSYAPIGYRNDREAHTIEIEPREAPFVERAFTLMAGGRYTLNTLRQTLYVDGLRSRRKGHVLSQQELIRILSNLIYTGDFVWNGVRYDGKHDAIVSRDLFDRVQEVMANRMRPRKRKHNFAFTGLIKCGHCGRAVTAEIQKGRHIYYRCSAQCDGVRYLTEREVARQFGEAVRRITLTADIVDWTIGALRESDHDRVQFRQEAIKRLEERRARLASYVDQAYQDRLDGRITVETWERKVAEWERERRQITSEIDAHEMASANYLNEGIRVLELAKSAYQLYISQLPREQRRLVDVVLSNARLTGTTIEYDYRKPFDMMLDVGDLEKWRGGRDLNPRPPA